ncbi:hypothetical protein OUZ56_003397 [Daphnia magna]|uniref:Uncharacterized protein n=1 Tax=Daphnia magna TaxID=35525 RepID=A0ABR0A8K2_9CRUS|nr:hypothetical protein OUZ56_003397 [Daphnia magna]
MRTRTADCGQEKLRTFTCGLAQNFLTDFSNLVSARRSRRVETVTRTSQWDYPSPLIGSLHPYILLCLSAFRSHIFLILN